MAIPLSAVSPAASGAQSPLSANPIDPELMAAAMDVVRAATSRHAPERVGVSFNGGKDSMVTAWLVKQALGEDLMRRCVFFVFEDEDEFPELRSFREEQAQALGVELVRTPGPIKDGLWRLHRDHGLEAAIVGMRKSDPSVSWLNNPITPCTEGWPPMTLYLPILEWGVAQVWDYTLSLSVPYCVLYERGFTSLGSRHKTTPNEALRCPNAPCGYLPAWALRDDQQERASRASSSQFSDVSARL